MCVFDPLPNKGPGAASRHGGMALLPSRVRQCSGWVPDPSQAIVLKTRSISNYLSTTYLACFVLLDLCWMHPNNFRSGQSIQRNVFPPSFLQEFQRYSQNGLQTCRPLVEQMASMLPLQEGVHPPNSRCVLGKRHSMCIYIYYINIL